MRFEKELSLARLLTQEAGSLASDYQRSGVIAESKADESPVTAADRACEKLIVEGIRTTFPDDGVLGEEGAKDDSASGRRWIIDPIDGTRDYVRGIPLWAVLLGLEIEGEITVASAFCPRQNWLITAVKSEGAWLDGQRLSVIDDKTDPGQAVLCFNGFHKAGVDRLAPKLLGWTRRFWAVRSLGGAVDAMLLAQGKADIWIEPAAEPWDLAPFKLILEEVGCRFGSFDRGNTIYGGNAWACVPGLVPVVQQLIS